MAEKRVFIKTGASTDNAHLGWPLMNKRNDTLMSLPTSKDGKKIPKIGSISNFQSIVLRSKFLMTLFIISLIMSWDSSWLSSFSIVIVTSLPTLVFET